MLPQAIQAELDPFRIVQTTGCRPRVARRGYKAASMPVPHYAEAFDEQYGVRLEAAMVEQRSMVMKQGQIHPTVMVGRRLFY